MKAPIFSFLINKQIEKYKNKEEIIVNEFVNRKSCLTFRFI